MHRTLLIGTSFPTTSWSCHHAPTRSMSSLPYSSSSSLPKRVKVVEVGARDGLQNENGFVETPVKIELIERLGKCGLPVIETASFVSPKWTPNMKDNAEVYAGVTKIDGVGYPTLTPNLRGYQDARKAGVTEVAVLSSAGATFCQKNLNCTIEESLVRAKEIVDVALEEGVKVRGYVSCAFDDPFDGPTNPSDVVKVVEQLIEMGCYEISLGDTTGTGSAGRTYQLLSLLKENKNIPWERIAVHFHNTYGQALANIVVALQMGVSTVDSSVAGLGGCPYAKGATGNVSTEDVVYLLHDLGIETGIDLDQLIDTGVYISKYLRREPDSNVSRAVRAKRTSTEE
eukprot:TRINITY_DN5908_c0_g1_i2.p1 TRINITY_DN5908_c0_g1~~TRINITY_DN5908_c0_g1_i2.p1  ORF type:complete len:342 (-),score=65.33 TRINITY_DN5908_c0_g1_i2:124-1149(-)